MKKLSERLKEYQHNPPSNNLYLVEVSGTNWGFRKTNLGVYQIILHENHIGNKAINENALSELKKWLGERTQNNFLFERISDEINYLPKKNLYCTSIRAIDPIDETLKNWAGTHISANSFEEAEKYCRENMGYCKVDGQLVAEIPCIDGTFEPDWSKIVEYN